MAARIVRPVIGINSDYTNATKNAPNMARLPIAYADQIFNSGGLPLVIPTMTKEADYDAILDRFDALVMTGGLDLDPRRQGQPTHITVQPMAERRESNDRILLQKAMERKMPVLAIGVGMQQLNAMMGGTLYLHLPAENPKAMAHFDPSGGPHRHIVNIEPKTRMDAIYGGGELRVNSAHHQGIKTLGSKLRVGAKSPDDVIEAIESTDPHWFCIGVQWHPESETASALDKQLFMAFIDAATSAASKPVLSLVA